MTTIQKTRFTKTIIDIDVCQYTGILYIDNVAFTIEQIARLKRRETKQTKQFAIVDYENTFYIHDVMNDAKTKLTYNDVDELIDVVQMYLNNNEYIAHDFDFNFDAIFYCDDIENDFDFCDDEQIEQLKKLNNQKIHAIEIDVENNYFDHNENYYNLKFASRDELYAISGKYIKNLF